MFNPNETPLEVRQPKALLLEVNRTVTSRHFTSLVLDAYVTNNCNEFLSENYLELSIRNMLEEMAADAKLEMDAPKFPAFPNISQLIEQATAYIHWATTEQKSTPAIREFR